MPILLLFAVLERRMRCYDMWSGLLMNIISSLRLYECLHYVLYECLHYVLYECLHYVFFVL